VKSSKTNSFVIPISSLDDHPRTVIRPARVEEISDILTLFEEEVRAGRMLPRNPDNMAAGINDWLVAEVGDQIVGCVSLVFFNEELCEVRSLAVHSDLRGNGLGGDLITAAVELARTRNMRRVLTLTRSLGVFERAGFVRDEVHNYPEKVWRDCGPCPFQERCDEIALIYSLEEGTTPDQEASDAVSD
jgi:amino-acid N-acetyltransferase